MVHLVKGMSLLAFRDSDRSPLCNQNKEALLLLISHGVELVFKEAKHPRLDTSSLSDSSKVI
jgi:hypothetical protein